MMRQQLEELCKEVQHINTTSMEGEISLRFVLIEIIRLLDEALPKEVEPD